MFNDKEKSFSKLKKEYGKCANKSCYICKNFILEPKLTSNALVLELKRIPLKLICQEAGLTDNQTAIVLKMNGNVVKDFLIDDWDSKLLEILILLLRIDFTQLARIPRNQLTNYSNILNTTKALLPFNNITEIENKESCQILQESSKNFNDNTARVAQNYCRNKDLYLMLVNTAVYGNFNYKYYENPTNYYKSAEYFALCGFGDSLDQIYQFHNIETQSQLSSNKCVNLETKIEKLKETPEANSTKQVPPSIPVNTATTILSQFQPAFWGVAAYPSTQIQVPNQNFWPKFLNFLTPQQILMQSYLANQPTPSLMGNYPSILQPTPPVLLPYSSPFQFFNETYINTSIIQQQQQYNFVGATNGNVYDLFYSQMLQKTQQITQTIFANKFEPQPRAISLSNTNNNDRGSSSCANNNNNGSTNIKQQSYLSVAKGSIKSDTSGTQKCVKTDPCENSDDI